jgi:hypothetical protein
VALLLIVGVVLVVRKKRRRTDLSISHAIVLSL